MNKNFSRCLIWAFVFNVLVPFGFRAHAQEQPQNREDGTEVIYSPPAPKWVPPQLGTLLPDWFNLDASWTAQPILNFSGGSQQTSSYADQWGFDLTFSSGIAKKDAEKSEFDRWSLHGNFGLQLGAPAYSDSVSSVFSPQSVYDDQGFWLRGLYLERNGENINLKFGPSMTMNDFVYADAYSYYINSMINNTLNLQVPGFSLDPYNAWGAAIELSLAKALTLKYGIFQLSSVRGQNTDSANQYLGWNLSTSSADGLVQALKFEYSYAPQPQGLKVCLDKISTGSYLRVNAGCHKVGAVENNLPKPIVQLGGYTAGWKFPYLDESGQLGPRINGIFVHGTSLPMRLPIGHGTSLWASAVLGSNQEINQVPFAIMAGSISQGVIPSRPFDQLVLAFSRSSLSANSNYNGSSQVYSAVAELDYVIKLNQRFAVEPGIQLIFNPSGNSDYATIVAPTLQLTLSF
ncbi:MAG: carbohydrate porin [Cyanobacteriota bacterium]